MKTAFDAQKYVDDKPFKKDEPPVRPDAAAPVKNKMGYYDLENQVAGYANMSIIKMPFDPNNPGATSYDVIDNETGEIMVAGIGGPNAIDKAVNTAMKQLNKQLDETGGINVGKYQINKNHEVLVVLVCLLFCYRSAKLFRPERDVSVLLRLWCRLG